MPANRKITGIGKQNKHLKETNMPKENQSWLSGLSKPPKGKPFWKPTGPTAKGIVGAIGQGINSAVGGYGNTINEIAGGVNSAYNKGAKTFNAVSNFAYKAATPAREAALEAAWQMVQQGNYFFGLPYSTGSYKDAIGTYKERNNGTLPPGPHSQGVDPATVLPFLDPLQSAPGSREPVQPAQNMQPVQSAPTQAALNQQWMQFWNNQGPRPAAGTIYKP
jgi:hypothetical protein